MSAALPVPTAALPPAAPGTTRLHIRNMVCPQCLRVARRKLEQAGLPVEAIALGAADVRPITPGQPLPPTEQLQAALHAVGFELVDDPRDQLVEQTKALVVELIHYTPADQQPLLLTYSHYLSQRLGRDYAYLSHLFSQRGGLTLEKYIIRQKVERAKELLSYQEATVADVARQLGYSSAAHLTNQFRQVTGLTPTQFQALGPGSAGRRSLDAVVG